MDQNAVVSEQTESGKRLIAALMSAGFDVRIAFWAKPTDEAKWFLYFASPAVDEVGPAAAYRSVFAIMRQTPNLWIDPLEVKVVGMNDSMAKAALAVTKPKLADSPFAVKKPTPYPGMTRFSGSILGGVSIDAAYIYPPPQSSVQS